MKKLLSIGGSSAIMAAIWTFGSIYIGLSTIAGFLAWSSFFAAGGNGIKSVKKALCANISGIFWGFLGFQITNLLMPSLGLATALAVGNALGSLFICMQSKISLVAFIPASFIGWSAFVATTAFNPNDKTAIMSMLLAIISMIIGSFVGLASEKLTDLLFVLFKGDNKKCESCEAA